MKGADNVFLLAMTNNNNIKINMRMLSHPQSDKRPFANLSSLMHLIVTQMFHTFNRFEVKRKFIICINMV